MRLYIICRPCDDTYYGGNPTGHVFATQEEANAFIEHECGPSDPEDPFEHEYRLYYIEGSLLHKAIHDAHVRAWLRFN